MADINLTFSELDFVSFGGGVAAGWASAYALYRARHLIGAARASVSQQASSAQEYARRSADSRYIGDLLKYIDRTHLAGGRIGFADLLIEPRFVTAPDLEEPADDDVLYSVFHVVPNIPDHPFLQAPYNVPTLSIADLNNGAHSLALLGQPGSGRTSALYAIALWSLLQVDFAPPPDPVQQRLEDEEEAVENDEQRAEMIRARLDMEERAVETLERKQGETVVPGVGLSDNMPFKQMTPFYTHLANIQPHIQEFGRRIDPAEPVLRALQHYVGRVTSQTLAGNFYERLAQGKVLLLLDGFDEIPEADQPQMQAWLQAYLEEYDDNFTIVTSLPTGYGKLCETGLTPIFLRPWNDVDTNRLADRWQNAWQKISGSRRAPEFDKRTITYAHSRNRAHTPFELTLKLWTTYEIENQSNLEDRFGNLLTRFASDNLDEVMPALQIAAQIQLDEGYITPERLEQMMTGMAVPEVSTEDGEFDLDALEAVINAGEDDLLSDEAAVFSDPEIDDMAEEDDLDALLDELDKFDDLADVPARGDSLNLDTEQPEADEEAEQPKRGRRKDKNEDSKSNGEKTTTDKEYVRLVRALVKNGMLIQHRNRRYQFRHPLLAAYLGSLRLRELGDEALFEKAYQPKWQDAIAYCAMQMPLDTLVKEHLESPADVLQNHLLETTRWLAYAPRDVGWRKPVLRALGNLLVAPNQYLLTRERIAAALVGSRDRNALVIFMRALRHPNPEVRRLACLGVGAFRAEDAIENISELLIDENPDVTLAAGLALGAIGVDDAYNEMVVALTEGSESLRQAIAEAFAAIPDIGYPVLFDAIYHEDYLLRRAAVFGLRRVNTPWALIALYRRSIEDDQWYVRSAAEQAFSDMQYGEKAVGVRTYPAPDAIPWLVQWMGQQAQNGGAQPAVIPPEQILRKALEEGNTEIQRISARNMGQLGMFEHTGILYTTLRHREEQVREAALRAIADLQLQMGQPLPAPI